MPTKDEINTFSINVEMLVKKNNMAYMDAIIMHCEQTGLEVELAAKLVSSVLKAKIQIEAEELHFLPKSNTAKLPV
jgi:hypothetical protein